MMEEVLTWNCSRMGLKDVQFCLQLVLLVTHVVSSWFRYLVHFKWNYILPERRENDRKFVFKEYLLASRFPVIV